MTPENKQEFIRQKANEHIVGEDEKILWSLHAVRKLRVEGLRKAKVENSLKKCIIIEDYHKTDGRLLPDCLVLEFVNNEPVHAVIAIDIDFDRIFIVTVYRPAAERWESDWKKRKN